MTLLTDLLQRPFYQAGMNAGNSSDRLRQHAHEWRVGVEETLETERSIIAFGKRDNQAVVLKIVKKPGDEWHAGEILEAFDGNGVVRVYEKAEGAVLMERLRPGSSLVEMTLNGRDEEATEILAGVIQQMSAHELPAGCTRVEDWAQGFERYIASGDTQIAKSLVAAGYRVYADLCASQQWPKLLHADLHHYNVLFDSKRGWLAIDPKGVIGEVEYEIGAILRNPSERPELFTPPATIERRLKQFTSRLNLDLERVLGWGFAQAVLSAIWTIEDGFTVDATNSSLRLANALRPML